MSKTFTELFVHMVWGTHGRAPRIVTSIEQQLYAVMSQKCRELECTPIALGGTTDHVHILVALSSTIAVATLVKEIKGASSYIITHGVAPDMAFRWQSGYGAFSLRKTDLPTVRNYVLQQKHHHQNHAIAAEWEPPSGND